MPERLPETMAPPRPALLQAVVEALEAGQFDQAAADVINTLRRGHALGPEDRQATELVIAEAQLLVAGLPGMTGLDKAYPKPGERGILLFQEIIEVIRQQDREIRALQRMLAELV